MRYVSANYNRDFTNFIDKPLYIVNKSRYSLA